MAFSSQPHGGVGGGGGVGGMARKASVSRWLQPSSLILIVAILTVLRLLAAANSGLAEDEAYYRLWGLSPALGYYDHPPMVGWWIWLGQALFGDTVLAIRFTGVLSVATGSVMLWRMAENLFGRPVAGWSVLFFNATILIGVGSVIATPDAPSVFFWGMALWAVSEVIRSSNANWWLVVGIAAGLGLASKYSVLFLGAGIVLWLIFIPQARRWWGAWQLWAGGALALAIFSPVLLWNAGHEWASFYKQFGRAVPQAWTLKYIGEFAGALIGLLNPLIAVLAAAGFARFLRRTWRGEAGAGLLIFTCLPFIAYLCFHALHDRVQANWPAPVFPALVIMAASVACEPPLRARRFLRWLAVFSVPLGVGLSLLVLLHAVDPFTGRLARKDPTFQTRGWDDVRAEIAGIARENGAKWIATNGYGLNGQLAFAFRGELPVEQLNERIRYVMQPPLDNATIAMPALFVTETRRDPGIDWLKQRFGTVEKLGPVTRRVEGVKLEDLAVYIVAAPDGDPRDPVYPLPQ